MIHWLAIALGGALGSVLRYAVSTGVHQWWGREFPYGTLVVNVLGSLLMGVLFILLVERLAVAPALRAFWLVGLLGAFTTFSTFSLETLNLMQAGELGRAAANVLLSVLLCIGAAAIGIALGRQL
ncbi:fluoride efflux transporter CrcB [Thiohalobacter thiocyanaticus]|uniref:Fluoride-specific ion channel FluC n=1 Tax=Thiohalobacter thiocyanaticus TaxID=585455 RepID=A0A426QE12_9GAMM|nr:fluoride efflux transporter CrcB [Thiohalobacter thiocyanaticus]RRQ19973.1 fluoride efflux transporter CrcB [Thiohalobacter thiocyanaticus]